MTMALVPEGPVALPPSMVERMTLIMDCFDGPNVRLLLEEITSRTGLPRSTAHRILEQLVRLEWVQHTRSGYRLGQRVTSWSAREYGHSDLRAAAAPWLHELAMRTRLVVHLAVLGGATIEFLDKIGGPRAAEVPTRVGGRAPAHATALGKAVLAWLPAEEVDMSYADADGVVDLAELHNELGQIRQRGGVAVERGELFPQIACIGAAVRGPDGPVGAISVVAPAQARLESLAPVVRDVAARTARDLFDTGMGRRRALLPA